MITALDIPYWIERIELLNQWLIQFPMSEEYRERTTYREFRELVRAKQVELGLTPEVIEQLRQFEDGSEDLRWAWTEVGMTEDNREMLCSTYFEDFPLNHYWMPEYEPVMKAVDDFMQAQPLYQGVSDEVLAEVVRKHLEAFPILKK